MTWSVIRAQSIETFAERSSGGASRDEACCRMERDVKTGDLKVIRLRRLAPVGASRAVAFRLRDR